jgi:hypothetical protein
MTQALLLFDHGRAPYPASPTGASSTVKRKGSGASFKKANAHNSGKTTQSNESKQRGAEKIYHRSVVTSWRPWSSRHDRFHLSNSAGAQREVHGTSVCNSHDVLESHLRTLSRNTSLREERKPYSTKSSEALQNRQVEEVHGLRVRQRGLQQRFHEVATGLDGEDHAGLQRARSAQLPDALRLA